MGFRASALLFLAILLVSFPLTESYADPQSDAETLIQAENALPHSDLSARLELVSQSFLGKPYLVGGPLGEGPIAKYDQDPLFRFDGFDCTTFIETTLALALSHDFPEFFGKLLKLRYQNGLVSFTTRNHFVELDWNPNNIAAGYFVDRTLDIGTSADQSIAVQNFSKRAWYQALPLSSLKLPGLAPALLETRLNELHQEGEAFADVTSQLPYLKKSSLLALRQALPVPAVLNIVRQLPSAKANVMVRVTHQVLLLTVNSELHVRAASSRAQVMRVIDLPYEAYVQSLIDSPSTLGVNVLQVSH